MRALKRLYKGKTEKNKIFSFDRKSHQQEIDQHSESVTDQVRRHNSKPGADMDNSQANSYQSEYEGGKSSKNKTVCSRQHEVSETIQNHHKKIKFSCCKMWCRIFICLNISRAWSNFKWTCCCIFCCRKKEMKVRNKYDVLMRKGVNRIEKDLNMLDIVKDVRYLMTMARG